jgi:hypothetical protein
VTPTGYQLTKVPFTAVQLSDSFWAPRIEANRPARVKHTEGNRITLKGTLQVVQEIVSTAADIAAPAMSIIATVLS